VFLFAVVRDVQANVLAGAHGGSQPPQPCRFYSLSCETYRRTRSTLRTGSSWWWRWMFLFAVVRDVQANAAPFCPCASPAAVSIRCRARRTGERAGRGRKRGPVLFLFAVVRDVQANRDPDYRLPRGRRRVSIRCRARRTGEPAMADQVGLRRCFYSLSCETYRRTCRFPSQHQPGIAFLFAVVRDVQANREPDARSYPA